MSRGRFGGASGSVLARSLVALSVLFAFAVAPVWAQQPTALPQSVAELVRVREDVYAFRYNNHVSIFVPTDEGVVVVDPIGGGGNPKAPAMLKEAIRSITDQPVRWMVYSHAAQDHRSGGIVFADTATFVSHANAKPRIEAANDPSSPVPDVTFEEAMTLELGGRTFELHWAAMNPEDDYLVFYYPAQKVLVTVDLGRVRTLPFGEIGQGPAAFVDFLARMDTQFDFDVYLSGHGPQANIWGTRQDLRDHRQFYLDLVAAVQAARDAGLPDNSEEMVGAVREALAPAYGTWASFPNGLAGNVRGVIRALDAG